MIKNILRWFVLLPTAFLAVVLANIVLIYICYFMTSGQFNEVLKRGYFGNYFFKTNIFIMSYAYFRAATFIFTAYYIAPKYKAITAKLFSVIAVLVGLLHLFITYYSWPLKATLVFGFVFCGLSSFMIFSDK